MRHPPPSNLHLSAFELDLMALNALDPDRLCAAERHLRGCSACRREWQNLAALRSEFEQAVLPGLAARDDPSSSKPGASEPALKCATSCLRQAAG